MKIQIQPAKYKALLSFWAGWLTTYGAVVSPISVDSRDLQTSWISIWRYHCLGEVTLFCEDLKSILITVWYNASEVFVHIPAHLKLSLQVPWIDFSLLKLIVCYPYIDCQSVVSRATFKTMLRAHIFRNSTCTFRNSNCTLFLFNIF